MLKKTASAVLIAGAMLVGAACGVSTPAPIPAPTPSPTATPGPVQPFEILDWRVEQKFPKGMELVVDLEEGRSPASFGNSRLTLTAKDKLYKVAPRSRYKTPVQNQMIFDIGGGNNFIPWTEFYGGTLEIADQEGNVRAETIGGPLVYEDTRFIWETRKSENFSVLFYGPEEPVNPTEVLAEAEALLAKYSVIPSKPIKIVVYKNKPDIDGAIPFRSKKHHEQMLTLGQAFADIDTVFVSREDRPINLCVLRHELMHLIVGTLAAKSDVPAWLNEGLAEYACSDRISSDEKNFLIYSRKSGEFMPLAWLHRFPGTPRMIMLAYAESHSFITFLVERYGTEKIVEILSSMKGLRLGAEDAIEKVYGKPLDALEAEWVESLSE